MFSHLGDRESLCLPPPEHGTGGAGVRHRAADRHEIISPSATVGGGDTHITLGRHLPLVIDLTLLDNSSRQQQTWQSRDRITNLTSATSLGSPSTLPHTVPRATTHFVAPLPLTITVITSIHSRALNRVSRIMAATAVSATAEHTTSLPNTRTSSPIPFSRHSTPPPASKPIPEDFRSSLAAWWNNASYKEARFAEERLLRRMEIFRPSPPEPAKGWFGWSTSQPVVKPTHEDDVRAEARGPVTGSGLVATLRNVFVPTPNPDAAPGHPADPVVSGSSPASSLSEKSKHRLSLHKKNQGKLVDYINTMEISSPDNEKSKEAVVVLHGYAAAMG